MKKFFYLFILFISLPCFGQITTTKMHAFSGTLLLSLDGGITTSKTDYTESRLGGRFTFGIEYYVPTSSSHIFGIRLYGGKQLLYSEDKNKIITIPGYGLDTLPDLIDTEMYIAGFGLIYSFSINDELFPYFSAGLSNVWFNPRLENGKSAPIIPINKFKKHAIAYDFDLGIRYPITDNLSVKLEGGLHFPNTDNLDNISTGTNKDFFATGIIGISYSFFANKDSDEDGVLDNIDKCPDEPEDIDGFNDNDGCPDNDNDKDGIQDYLDRCSDIPEDFDNFQDSDGCPDMDNDLDNITDALDECPDQSEDIDGFEDKDGCPDPDNDGDGVLDKEDKCPDIPGSPANDGCSSSDSSSNSSEYIGAPREITIEGEATFYSGKADIVSEAQGELNRIVKILALYPEIDWRIEGHTDRQVTENLMVRSLSLRRAEAILNYFVSKGLPSYQFRVYDMGDKFPIANNNTEYGRMRNRRIVLVREN